MDSNSETHNLPTYDVTSYGALANDAISDQAAIDAAEANGGGVVFFPAGVWSMQMQVILTALILIGSNIILKGSGSVPGGTVINMVNHMLQPSGSNPGTHLK